MSTRVVTRLLPIVVLLFGFLFLPPTYVAAQDVASITGAVTDPTGLLIDAASLEV